MKLSNKSRTGLKTIDLSEYAFYQGAQGVPLTETIREIDSSHSQERAKVQEDSVRREKPLEAAVQELERVEPLVDAAWNDILRRFGHHVPPVAVAFLILFLGLGALIVDSILLGPGLDAAGISDAVEQLVAAFGLAALSSLVFHLAHETFAEKSPGLETRIIWRSLGAFTVVALLGWGVLRGLQAKFGADINQNPLGTFLGDHPMLASIFFCFVTLAAPLVGAAAIHHTAPRIHEWRTWKRAKQAHEQMHTKLNDAQKKLESERATLAHRLSRLEAQKENWQATAAQYYERGRLSGAKQTPHWLVLLKATALSLAGLVLGCVVGTFLPLLYFALPVGTWITAFLYYRHVRFHPDYGQFKRQENTRFAVGVDGPQIVLPSTPKLLPPPEGSK